VGAFRKRGGGPKWGGRNPFLVVGFPWGPPILRGGHPRAPGPPDVFVFELPGGPRRGLRGPPTTRSHFLPVHSAMLPGATQARHRKRGPQKTWAQGRGGVGACPTPVFFTGHVTGPKRKINHRGGAQTRAGNPGLCGVLLFCFKAGPGDHIIFYLKGGFPGPPMKL